MADRRGISGALSLACTILSLLPARLPAQELDPFSIRVESKLVLVHTEVYNEHFSYGPTMSYRRCADEAVSAFFKVPPSEPYLPRDCNYEIVIHGLGATDFHVFEDGIEQKIESVTVQRRAWISARDNFGSHDEWSFTPRGKWSSSDLRDGSAVYATYFYQIAYVPSEPEEGKCHKIRVTVDKPRVLIYFRDQYCYTEHPASDPLRGTEFGKLLENDLQADRRPKIPLSLHASFFYVDSQKARVDVVLAFPWDRLKLEWIEGDLHATIGVLGMVYKKDRIPIARFTDLACCASGSPIWTRSGVNPPGLPDLVPDYHRHDSWYLPSRYEGQIDLPPGEYTLRMVLSDGKKFGRAELPLVIESYDGKQLAISSVVLSKRFRNAAAAAQEAAAANLAPMYVPLVSKGVQITPTAETSFKRSDPLIAYFEVYEPLLNQLPKTAVTAHIRIVDAKTGVKKVDFPPLDAAPYERPGSFTIPIGDELKFGQLPRGDYRLEVQATDSGGRSTPWHAANFTIE